MNLGQLRLEVRRALGEMEADLWTDSELNDWLNEGCKVMASNCQHIQSIYQCTTVANQQEYVLPDDVDEIFNVVLYSTGVYPLQPVDASQVQIGVSSSGTPGFFYTRNIATSTGNHTGTGITVGSADSHGGQHLVIGLFPPPSDAYQLTVFYYSRHADMKSDGAVPLVPCEFHRGLIAYAGSLGKEKEYAYAEADRKRSEFKDFCERLKDKMISGGQEMAFPVVRTDEDRVLYGDVIFKFGTAT